MWNLWLSGKHNNRTGLTPAPANVWDICFFSSSNTSEKNVSRWCATECASSRPMGLWIRVDRSSWIRVYKIFSGVHLVAQVNYTGRTWMWFSTGRVERCCKTYCAKHKYIILIRIYLFSFYSFMVRSDTVSEKLHQPVAAQNWFLLLQKYFKR